MKNKRTVFIKFFGSRVLRKHQTGVSGQAGLTEHSDVLNNYHILSSVTSGAVRFIPQ